MAILPIYTMGDDILRQEAKEIQTLDQSLQQFIKNMFETMYQADGIGLAAPQVGQSHQLLLVDVSFTRDGADVPPLALINPVILDKEGSISMEEGCLSIPGLNDFVDRPEFVTVEYTDHNFNRRTEKFSGLAARVIQHEYDHLIGTLFVDYLSAFRKSIHKSKIRDIQRGNIEVDYSLATKKQT